MKVERRRGREVNVGVIGVRRWARMGERWGGERDDGVGEGFSEVVGRGVVIVGIGVCV